MNQTVETELKFAIKHPTNSKTVKDIIKAIDEEFIYSKGKTVSLEKRYPKLFDKKNFENLFFVEKGGEMVSFIAVKKLDIKVEKTSEKIRLFLIGCVYTPQKYRGNGFSSTLLKHVSEYYFMKGFDAGFLWTTQQEFYARFGWMEYETGQFVSLKSLVKTKPDKKPISGESVQIKIGTRVNHAELNAIRTQSKDKLTIIRNLKDSDSYNVIPSPATKTKIVIAKQGSTTIGYGVIGFQSQNAFVYEIVPPSKLVFSKALSYITNVQIIENVYLNLPASYKFSELYKSLASEIEIKPQRLTMVIAKNKSTLRSLKNIYIPFIDRI